VKNQFFLQFFVKFLTKKKLFSLSYAGKSEKKNIRNWKKVPFLSIPHKAWGVTMRHPVQVGPGGFRGLRCAGPQNNNLPKCWFQVRFFLFKIKKKLALQDIF
jgi:hypothetical protein